MALGLSSSQKVVRAESNRQYLPGLANLNTESPSDRSAARLQAHAQASAKTFIKLTTVSSKCRLAS